MAWILKGHVPAAAGGSTIKKLNFKSIRKHSSSITPVWCLTNSFKLPVRGKDKELPASYLARAHNT